MSRHLGAHLHRLGVAYSGSAALATFAAIVCFALGTSLTTLMASITVGLLVAVAVPGGRRLLGLGTASASRQPHERTNTLIYGAGSEAEALARELNRRDSGEPIAVVDDDTQRAGQRLAGLRVYSSRDLPGLVEELNVGRVILALPAAARGRTQKILDVLEPLHVHVLSIPEPDELISGRARLDDLREISMRELVGRPPVLTIPTLLSASVQGKSVLVTGAGGTIGTELCRQILALAPRTLVLLERSEIALYSIQRELNALAQHSNTGATVVPILSDIQQRGQLRELFETHGVETVYHTAAYKHALFVEQNVVDGARNNVLGTLACAEAALDARVETFVLVSTDKAANPTSAMGATKRLAELVILGLGERGGKTRFCAVRFGNVLAGSVVPLFLDQIRAGGPVTVSHPDVVRYFMSSAEAAQLLLQAGSLAQGGEVFVLDMGAPVRIAGLARRMIRLLGFTVRDATHPGGDIEIEYTGLRPAERLYEELSLGDDILGTEHPLILRARQSVLAWHVLGRLLEQLSRAIGTNDSSGVVRVLREAIPEYGPSREQLEQQPLAPTGTTAIDDLSSDSPHPGLPLRLIVGGKK